MLFLSFSDYTSVFSYAAQEKLTVCL